MTIETGLGVEGVIEDHEESGSNLCEEAPQWSILLA